MCSKRNKGSVPFKCSLSNKRPPLRHQKGVFSSNKRTRFFKVNLELTHYSAIKKACHFLMSGWQWIIIKKVLITDFLLSSFLRLQAYIPVSDFSKWCVCHAQYWSCSYQIIFTFDFSRPRFTSWDYLNLKTISPVFQGILILMLKMKMRTIKAEWQKWYQRSKEKLHGVMTLLSRVTVL